MTCCLRIDLLSYRLWPGHLLSGSKLSRCPLSGDVGRYTSLETVTTPLGVHAQLILTLGRT